MSRRMRAITGAVKGLLKVRRRGVVAILAMMFLVLFGSLGVAMAVASKGNLRTAATHIHVVKALGAAETGLAVGQQRLEAAASRFVVGRGTIDGTLGWKLWSGTATAADTSLDVRTAQGFSEGALPAGIAAALVNHHYADGNTLSYSGSVSNAVLSSAPAGSDTNIYRDSNWVVTPITAIDGSAADSTAKPAAYQITYAPLANGTDIRVIVTGYSSIGAGGTAYAYGGETNAQPVTRTIYRDFRLAKRHRHAIISPSKVMIGKGVNVTGSLGMTYTDVDKPKGDPLVVKSDFYGLNAALDQKLRDFFGGVKQYDVDGDNRLRPAHPGESQGLPPGSRDYNGDGQPDNAFGDVTGDGYVDDFDIFLRHYDTNGDGKLTMSSGLTTGTPAAGLSPEFSADDDLALLIDSGVPDRNRNGVSGWQDTNRNGRWDSAENLNDYDASTGTYPDRVLGWRDGVIDRKDQYGKVRGQLMFRTTQSAWESAQSHDYQDMVNGAVTPESGVSPTQFGANAETLPELSLSDIANATSSLRNLADGQSFANQVATALGVSSAVLPAYLEVKPAGTARYFRSDMDNAAAKALTGQDLWEKAPYNSPSYTDWYIRPRYENMTFKNVTIPAGNNGLFVNCTFVGVTYVQSNTSNTHTNWSLYGKLQWDAAQSKPVPSTQPLDKSDFARYTTGNVLDGPTNYADFPDPPIINGATRTGTARNTKLYSNNIRFHNCTFVGSVVSDTPAVFTPVRNKLQFTGSTRFSSAHPDQPQNPSLNPDSADAAEIAKSSMMLPQYSVELGQFNSPTDTYSGSNPPPAQSIALSGTIVAGVLDARGNTSIDGTLLMTFKPVLGEAPLAYNGAPVGNPANFNLSLGYFGPDDGELESLDPATLPVVGGQRIVGYDTDGDGLADAPATGPQPTGSTAVPFYGYGRVTVTYNPNLPMPDGIRLPLSVAPVGRSYKEGKP